jgi:hypothetical protein
MGFTCRAYHAPWNEYWKAGIAYGSQWGFVAMWLAKRVKVAEGQWQTHVTET